MLTRKDIKYDILPVLRKKYMDKNEDKVYQPIEIRGYHYGDLFEMFTLKDVPLLANDLDTYYRANTKDYDWREIMDWAHKNAGKLKYKYTKYPNDERIMAIKHDSATSILFSPEAMVEISGGKKIFVCPLYEVFVLFMYKGRIEDFVEFVKIIKAMNYSMLQGGNLGRYISDTIFVYDPLKTELSIVNTEKEFGVKFNVVTLNILEGDLKSQIRKEANNVLLNELKDYNYEDAYEVLSNKQVYESMLDEVEENIRRVMKDGKDSK